MKISAKTDTGLVRNNNEDCYRAGYLSNGGVWAVVCDGMGGASGGNVASETAVNVISEKITSGFHEGMNDNSLKLLIVSAVETANAQVYSKSAGDTTLFGMGTTAAVAVIIDDNVYLAHVGDSRIYIFSENSAVQLTTDHSVVQMMIERGEITREEAKDHPQKNVITRALGVEPYIKVDYAQEVFNSGDTLVLCSDGLTNFVSDEDILRICNEGGDNIADRLVDAANANGGGDNITVVTVSD